MKELLSPAGDIKSLKAAIFGGADAIYVGMKDFGARKYASNFTKEEIKEATTLCHLYGVKLYVTLNTVIKDEEVNSFLELVDYLYHLGIDAFIMQDFGMICLLLDIYEDIEIHASTQFNNSSIETLKLLKDLGVKRVVLSRELTLKEIEKINIDIEKEVFIHGALCISYSGNCLFSSMLGHRSGNRGECTACCRLPYKLYEEDKLINEGYLLSTKELNTSPRFDELLKSNIKSFKIEGRMKSSEYVYFITKFYRNLIDGKKNTPEDLESLKILFNRGFTTGNLFEDNLINSESPNHIGLKIGKVLSITKEKIKIKLTRKLNQEDGIRFYQSKKGMIVNFLYNEKNLLVNTTDGICYVKNTIDLKGLDDVYLTSSKYLSNTLLNYEPKKIKIKMKFTGCSEQKAKLELDDGKNRITCLGAICQSAKKRPLTKEEIKEKLTKLGNTIYEIESIDINLEDDIFLPISQINDLRRCTIEKLNEERCKIKRLGRKNPHFEKLKIKSTQDKSLIISTERDLLTNKSYQKFYTKDISLFNKYKENKNIYYIEKRNSFEGKISKQSLIGEYQYPNNSISDYSFNVTNIYSVYYLLKLGYLCVTLSVELKDEEINALIEKFYQVFNFYPNVEVVCLDRIKLMTIKGNILNLKQSKEYTLIDKEKRKYPVYFDGVNTEILNYELEIKKEQFHCNKRYNNKYLK